MTVNQRFLVVETTEVLHMCIVILLERDFFSFRQEKEAKQNEAFLVGLTFVLAMR